MKRLLLVVLVLFSVAGCTATPMPLPLTDGTPPVQLKDSGRPPLDLSSKVDGSTNKREGPLPPPPIHDSGRPDGSWLVVDGIRTDGLKDAIGERRPEVGPSLDGLDGATSDLRPPDGTLGKD